jgi:hypothetical protein
LPATARRVGRAGNPHRYHGRGHRHQDRFAAAKRATTVDHGAVEPARCGALRRAGYGTLQLLAAPLLSLPLAVGLIGLLLPHVPYVDELLDSGPGVLTGGGIVPQVKAGTAALYLGGLLVGLFLVGTVSRLARRCIRPERSYRLYGLRFVLRRWLAGLTNVRAFTFLFGDCAAIPHYLELIGYRLTRLRQTGTNFGQQVKHDNPHLVRIGTGTVVADGLSIINADYTNTSFRVRPAEIGERSFLGNNIAYPAEGRTGANCLLGTKVMVPMDGPVREGRRPARLALLEIPRTVHRDAAFEPESPQELRRLIAAKTRHNAVTIGLYLVPGHRLCRDRHGDDDGRRSHGAGRRRRAGPCRVPPVAARLPTRRRAGHHEQGLDATALPRWGSSDAAAANTRSGGLLPADPTGLSIDELCRVWRVSYLVLQNGSRTGGGRADRPAPLPLPRRALPPPSGGLSPLARRRRTHRG